METYIQRRRKIEYQRDCTIFTDQLLALVLSISFRVDGKKQKKTEITTIQISLERLYVPSIYIQLYSHHLSFFLRILSSF